MKNLIFFIYGVLLTLAICTNIIDTYAPEWFNDETLTIFWTNPVNTYWEVTKVGSLILSLIYTLGIVFMLGKGVNHKATLLTLLSLMVMCSSCHKHRPKDKEPDSEPTIVQNEPTKKVLQAIAEWEAYRHWYYIDSVYAHLHPEVFKNIIMMYGTHQDEEEVVENYMRNKPFYDSFVERYNELQADINDTTRIRKLLMLETAFSDSIPIKSHESN